MIISKISKIESAAHRVIQGETKRLRKIRDEVERVSDEFGWGDDPERKEIAYQVRLQRRNLN